MSTTGSNGQSNSAQPITLYGHKRAPNPWKITLILEELDVPYSTKYLEFPDTKVEPFISLNPNGKLPAIWDPNHNVTLFESGAIIEYLVDQYDQGNQLGGGGCSLQHRFLARAWLHLQMSAQGPACGYKVWMNRIYDAGEIVSVNEYLTGEIKRVLGVLDSHLGTTGGPYLLGPNISYADLAFVPHYLMLSVFVPGYGPHDAAAEYPHFTAWLERLKERPAVKKIMAMKAALVEE